MTKRPRAGKFERAHIKVPDTVLTREIDGEMVLLDLASETYYGLDDVGTRFWARLAEHGSLPRARQALLEEFDVDAALLERDLNRLLADLESRGLLAIRRG